MFKRVFLTLISGLFITGAQASVFPSGAMDDQSDAVLAYHSSRCVAHADAQLLVGADRETFIAACRVNAGNVFTVGYEESAGDE